MQVYSLVAKTVNRGFVNKPGVLKMYLATRLSRLDITIAEHDTSMPINDCFSFKKRLVRELADKERKSEDNVNY